MATQTDPPPWVNLTHPPWVKMPQGGVRAAEQKKPGVPGMPRQSHVLKTFKKRSSGGF